jgi:hypothetical protein
MSCSDAEHRLGDHCAPVSGCAHRDPIHHDAFLSLFRQLARAQFQNSFEAIWARISCMIASLTLTATANARTAGVHVLTHCN